MPTESRPTSAPLAGRRLEVQEPVTGILVATIGTGELGLFDPVTAAELRELVDRADRDPRVRGVVLTGRHPERFVSHASIRWLQEGGHDSPSVGLRAASLAVRLGALIRNTRILGRLAKRTPLAGIIELDALHDTFLRMNRSGVLYVAALNGSALGVGAELAWACDIRLMADGDHFIGQPEILLGFNPGGGGTQRLTRLIGTHRSLLAILDGAPYDAHEAVESGAVDELVAPSELVTRAAEVARSYGTRPKAVVGAVKRAVYLGGSASLTAGLHRERAEFLTLLSTDDAQERMLAYLRQTEAAGELPLYDPASYTEALETGRLPRHREHVDH